KNLTSFWSRFAQELKCFARPGIVKIVLREILAPRSSTTAQTVDVKRWVRVALNILVKLPSQYRKKQSAQDDGSNCCVYVPFQNVVVDHAKRHIQSQPFQKSHGRQQCDHVTREFSSRDADEDQPRQKRQSQKEKVIVPILSNAVYQPRKEKDKQHNGRLHKYVKTVKVDR